MFHKPRPVRQDAHRKDLHILPRSEQALWVWKLSKWAREAPSGVDVLIVGAGIGGLYSAIEMHRKGHTVRILESKPELQPIGDFVGIGKYVSRHFSKWPGMDVTFEALCYKPLTSFLKHNGELVGQPFSLGDSLPCPIHRAKLLGFLLDRVAALGIPVTFGKHIIDYFEISDGLKAGVLTATGDRFEADLVVAADGVGSKSCKLVQGSPAEIKSSGFAVYRTSFLTSLAQKDSLVAERFAVLDNGYDNHQIYLGPESHAISILSKDLTTWIVTHKDTEASTTWWSKRVTANEVLRELASGTVWDPALLRLIEQTPGDTVIGWQLLPRDPVSKWISDQGRVVQLGDAAHSFLPSSGSGGTQACEDGLSLAACLFLSGKNNIPLATRVHNTLRPRKFNKLVG